MAETVQSTPPLPTSAIEPGNDAEDDEGEFAASDYESVTESDSTSIASSVYAHTYEHGRRYHKFRNGRYPIPNDDVEQNRDDMKHAMIMEVTNGKLHFAPIKENPQNILDLGTGSGIWAIDFGDKYPSAQVVGIDLSPIQPMWVPPNVKFMVDDIEDTWLHSDFDLIHTRFVAPVLRDLPKMLRQSLENLKPGGWLEVQEVCAKAFCDDGTMPDDYPVDKFFQLLNAGFVKLGGNLQIVESMAKLMKEAGFVNVQEKVVKLPVGTWAKDKTLRLVGMYWRTAIYDLLPATLKLFLTLGMTPEEIEVHLVEVRKALTDTTVHSYANFHFVYGQKAEAE